MELEVNWLLFDNIIRCSNKIGIEINNGECEKLIEGLPRYLVELFKQELLDVEYCDKIIENYLISLNRKEIRRTLLTA